jgi:hypothetical protein
MLSCLQCVLCNLEGDNVGMVGLDTASYLRKMISACFKSLVIITSVNKGASIELRRTPNLMNDSLDGSKSELSNCKQRSY